jgi:GAF domain-containing protein
VEVDMTRETDVVRSLVEMADTLVDDYDVVDLLTGLANRCVNLLGASAAGVMLASPQGSLGLVASSSEAMRLLELFELQAQEGPCLDAFRTGQPVGQQELRAGSGRWPSFSAAARKVGFRSAFALPLRLREATLGALNLLSVSPTPMDEANVTVARAFADLATLSIVQHRATAEAQRLTRQRRPGRGFHPAAALRPEPQPPPHRRRRSRHQRHPRSAGLVPLTPGLG